MIDKFFFIFSYSSIQFVHKAIDGGVHVFFGVIGVNRTAIYLDRGFSFMPQFFYRKDTVYVRHQIEMTLDLFDFGLDITSEGIGYLDVMA